MFHSCFNDPKPLHGKLLFHHLHPFKTGSLGFNARSHVFVHSGQANVEQSLGFFTMDVYRHGATAAPMATWGICNPTGLQFDVVFRSSSFSAF